jgi:hypothetical protein
MKNFDRVNGPKCILILYHNTAVFKTNGTMLKKCILCKTNVNIYLLKIDIFMYFTYFRKKHFGENIYEIRPRTLIPAAKG